VTVVRVRFGLVRERVGVATRAKRRAGRIERDETAADDDHLAAEIHPEASVHIEQVVDRLDHAVELDTGSLQIAPERDAD
jgi:hypothetical protein